MLIQSNTEGFLILGDENVKLRETYFIIHSLQWCDKYNFIQYLEYLL